MTAYIHFQRPDGSVFHKLASIPTKQIKGYLAKGCVPIDASGAPIKKAALPKAAGNPRKTAGSND
ncbi:MAG: hypothetical protein V3U35_08845 [Candidatus Neomarinimicrobiota bacterium]